MQTIGLVVASKINALYRPEEVLNNNIFCSIYCGSCIWKGDTRVGGGSPSPGVGGLMEMIRRERGVVGCQERESAQNKAWNRKEKKRGEHDFFSSLCSLLAVLHPCEIIILHFFPRFLMQEKPEGAKEEKGVAKLSHSIVYLTIRRLLPSLLPQQGYSKYRCLMRTTTSLVTKILLGPQGARQVTTTI